jgi:hypothetical protein
MAYERSLTSVISLVGATNVRLEKSKRAKTSGRDREKMYMSYG